MSLTQPLVRSLTRPLTRPLVQSSAFVPSDISGLILWLDAADSATITESGGSVSAWADKSGNSNNATQSTPLDQPTTGVATINGVNSVQFLQQGMELPVISTARTLIFVTNNANGDISSANVCTLIGEQAAAMDYIFIRTNTSDYTMSIDGSSGATGTIYVDNGDTGSGGNINAGTTVAEKAAERVWVVVGDQDFNFDALCWFNVSTFFRYANIDLGEVLIYNRALSNAEINQLGAYLQDKFSITWTSI